MDPELKVVVVPVTPFQQNCSLLWCQQTGKGAAIDPGGDVEQIVAAAQEHGIEIERLLPRPQVLPLNRIDGEPIGPAEIAARVRELAR